MQACARTTQNTHRILGFFLVTGLAALPAIAGTPKALDHVPTEAQVVVVIPNVGELLNDINAINMMMGEQGEPNILAVTSMIRGWPGINLNGSLAAVVTFDDNGDNPDGVVLIPVSDFEVLSQGIAPDNGVVELPMGGQMIYLRDAGGGFAVIGDDDGTVRDYDASGGHLKAHSKVLGNAGTEIAGNNDIFVYVNFDAFQDQIAEGMKQLEDQGEMVEMMSGEEAAAGFDAFVNVAKTVVNDGRSFAMGLSFDQEVGVSFDVGLQFKDGSSSASYLQNKGNAGKYFANVPAMDYFFASAFDFSGDGIQKLMSGYIDMVEQFDTTGMMKGMNLKALTTGFKGGVEVMGASDNIMGGLLANTMYYMEVDDADKYIDAIQGMYNGLNENMGELADIGVEINASMDEEPTTINGVDAYGYSFAMDLSGLSDTTGGMGGPNPAMFLGMIFGPDGGPSGYMAKAGHGLVTTMSKDAGFFSKVAAAAETGKDSMKGDQSIAYTARLLQKNLISETFIGADHLVNTAGPMLMMFGVIPEFEPLDALPPIGMGLSADGGGVLFRTVVPMNTISSVMELIPEEVMGGDDDSGDDEYGDDDSDGDDDGDMD